MGYTMKRYAIEGMTAQGTIRRVTVIATCSWAAILKGRQDHGIVRTIECTLKGVYHASAEESTERQVSRPAVLY